MNKLGTLLTIFVFAAVTLAVCPMFGSKLIGPHAVFSLSETEAILLWQIRLPRTLLAFIAGSALAVSGLAFQAIFRNPLATPFTLGISSGASLGAAAFIRFGLPLGLLGGLGVSLSAFFGACFAVFVVYGLTRLRKGLSTATMLLAGVAVSFCFTSIILFMQYTADFHHSFQIVRWLMGGLEVVGFQSVWNIAPFVVVGSGVILSLSHELNLMTTGEDLATSRGVDVKRTIWIIFLFTSLMIGAVVSVCGPIGFVGMMAPHICRLLIGWNHKLLVPASIVFGGAFLVLCDTVARTLLAPVEVPVGIITAMLGGPFFLWLLVGGSARRINLGD